MNYRTMVSCEEVFERLTSGPFPARQDQRLEIQNHDQLVQRHIDDCCECRALAESLRPGLNAIHEALIVPADDDLPLYRSLEEATGSSTSLAFNSESYLSSRSPEQPWMTRNGKASPATWSAVTLNSFGHVLAMLLVCLGFAAFGILAMERTRTEGQTNSRAIALVAPAQEGIPSEAGVDYLRGLGIQMVCLTSDVAASRNNRTPNATPELTTGQDEQAVSTRTSFDCCTECHSADRKPEIDPHENQESREDTKRFPFATVSVSLLAQSCSVCHIE